MRVAIVGGKLQGIEASYLAHKAGWEVCLVDKNPDVPARGLSDSFYQINIIDNDLKLSKIFQSIDLIIPATEDNTALRCLKERAVKESLPLAFDSKAYSISSSKKRSNLLFTKLGIPVPNSWPRCGFPLIIKPSYSSGSKGIKKINNTEDLQYEKAVQSSNLKDRIIQEYIEGPIYSIEVSGFKSNFTAI